MLVLGYSLLLLWRFALTLFLIWDDSSYMLFLSSTRFRKATYRSVKAWISFFEFAAFRPSKTFSAIRCSLNFTVSWYFGSPSLRSCLRAYQKWSKNKNKTIEGKKNEHIQLKVLEVDPWKSKTRYKASTSNVEIEFELYVGPHVSFH